MNNIVIQRNTTVNVTNIRYANTHVSNAVITVGEGRFGQAHMHGVLDPSQLDVLRQIHGALPIKPEPVNLTGNAVKGISPPEHMLLRPVVTARPSPEYRLPWHPGEAATPVKAAGSRVALPEHPIEELPQPEFGSHTGAERQRPPQLLQFEGGHGVRPATASGIPQIPAQQTRSYTPDERPSFLHERPNRVMPGFNQGETGAVHSPGVFHPPERMDRGMLPGQSANHMYRRPEFTSHFEGGHGHR